MKQSIAICSYDLPPKNVSVDLNKNAHAHTFMHKTCINQNFIDLHPNSIIST